MEESTYSWSQRGKGKGRLVWQGQPFSLSPGALVYPRGDGLEVASHSQLPSREQLQARASCTGQWNPSCARQARTSSCGEAHHFYSQPGREALSTPTWPWPLGVPLHPEKPALFPSPLDAPPDPAPTWGPSASSWTPAAASQLLPCSSALWPLLHHGALQMPLLTLHLIPSASPSPFHA